MLVEKAAAVPLSAGTQQSLVIVGFVGHNRTNMTPQCCT